LISATAEKAIFTSSFVLDAYPKKTGRSKKFHRWELF